MSKIKSFSIILVVIIMSFLTAYVFGWVEPTAPAPGGNVAPPLNTGSDTQSKTGILAATQFNDSNDSSYLLDPDVTSYLKHLELATDCWTSGNTFQSLGCGDSSSTGWRKAASFQGDVRFVSNSAGPGSANTVTFNKGTGTSMQVGIGTGAATLTSLLNVVGDVAVVSRDNTTDLVTFNEGAVASTINVGIGTAAPTHILDVKGKDDVQDKVTFTSGLDLPGGVTPSISVGIGTDSPALGAVLDVRGGNVVVVGGKIGIGTPSPGASLDVPAGEVRIGNGSTLMSGHILCLMSNYRTIGYCFGAVIVSGGTCDCRAIPSNP